MEEVDKWAISLGFYPGILLGIRTYEWSNATQYVLYLPFIDISIMVYDDE